VKTGIITVLLAAAIVGCGDNLYAQTAIHKPAPAETRRATPYADLVERHQRGDRQALRIREDVDRHRLWVLALEHVYVYDTRKLTLIRRIRLPGWSVADFMCPPDLALDRRGNAFVSNNVQPRLLQIIPASFQKKEHQLTLISAKRWEVGFGALAFGSDGTLFALTGLAGSLFKIDLASGNATEIALSEPVIEACTLASARQSTPPTEHRAVSLCVSFERRSRRVDISADLTRGQVTNESCDG